MLKRIIKFGLFVALILAIWQWQAIGDWWALRDYEPSQRVAQLADSTTMSDQGRRLFYVSRPEIHNKRGFTRQCPNTESSVVLGCYTGGLYGRTFLLQVDRQAIEDVMDVTAAHEMLHVAYARLSPWERDRVNGLLNEAYSSIDDQRLQELVNEYQQHDSASIENELHSLLGTQVADIGPELETYYEQYFTNRDRVVNLYRNYEDVFAQLNADIERLRDEINQLKDEIQTLKQQIERKKAELDTTRSRMDRLRAQGRVEEYNALVPRHNRLQEEYNALVREHNRKVALHNQKVEELNKLAVRQNDLVQSISGSELEPVN